MKGRQLSGVGSGDVIVVKYGGHAMTDVTAQLSFAKEIVDLVHAGRRLVVVHGGGPQVNVMLDRLGIESTFVAGLRATSAAAMDVVRMVLVGQVRSELTGLINDLGVPAIGLSGEDAGLMVAARFQPMVDGELVDIGQVGEVVEVRPAIVLDLLSAGYLPVVSTVARGRDGLAYNVNADVAAGALAGALAAERLVVLTDVSGVYRDWPDETTLIEELGSRELEALLPSLQAGMVPKLQGCLAAIEAGVPAAHVVDGRVAGVVTAAVNGEPVGTTITAGASRERARPTAEAKASSGGHPA